MQQLLQFKNQQQAEDSDDVIHEFKAGAQEIEPSTNMKTFRDMYGKTLEIPSYSVFDAKMWPKDPNYFLQVVKYKLPNASTTIKTYQDGELTQNQNITEAFSGDKYDLANLKLMKVVQDEETEKQVLEEFGEEMPIDGALEANIQFSPDGRFLAVIVSQRTLRIYELWQDGEDEEQALGNFILTFRDQEPMQEFIDKDEIAAAQNLEFDENSNILVTFGDESYNIIPLVHASSYMDSQQIDLELFDRILDVQMVTEEGIDSNDQQQFKCEIAIKLKDENCIHIFDIKDLKNSESTVDTNKKKFYYAKQSEFLQVKISQDFKKAILVNEHENYILEQMDDEEDDGAEFGSEAWQQNSMTWLKGDQVRSICNYGSDFMIICCLNYDNAIAIRATNNEKFELSIERGIEPGSFQIFDLYNGQIESETNLSANFRILSQRDEEIFLDVTNNHEEKILDRLMFSKYRAFCPFWPFFGFQGLESNENYFWLIDVNKPNVINRILFSYDIIHLSQAYITETQDLFIVCNKGDGYIVFQIDLDDEFDNPSKQEREFNLREVCSYSIDQVAYKPLYDIHVRASSNKRKIKINEKLMIFFLHGHGLYQWTQGDKEVKLIQETEQTKIIRIRDNTMVVREDKKLHTALDEDKADQYKDQYQKFNLNLINIEFGTISTERIHSEKLLKRKDNIVGFGYEHKQSRLILLYQQANGERSTIKIMDTENNTQLWKSVVKGEELIGRIKSGLFNLVDGHIYYGENIIKIRYDLLDQNQDREYNEDEIFDIYPNVLDIKKKQRVKTGMPLSMSLYHKLVYIIKNESRFGKKATKILILPYLHERQILLSRNREEGSQYFYTTVQNHSRKSMRVSNLHSSCKDVQTGQTLFVSMNLTDHKIFVYNQKGVIKSKNDFGSVVKDFGAPQSVSPNGRIFLFKAKESDTINLNIMYLDDGGCDQYQFKHLKTVDVISELQSYRSSLNGTEEEKEFQQKLNAVYRAHFDKKMSKMSFNINDKMDITVKIMSKDDKKKKLQDKKKKDALDLSIIKEQSVSLVEGPDQLEDWKKQLIFIQRVGVNLDPRKRDSIKDILWEMDNDQNDGGALSDEKLDGKYSQQILVAPAEEIAIPHYGNETQKLFRIGVDGYTINNRYAFFWNHHSVWCLDLDKMKIDGQNKIECKKIGLYVDRRETQTYIKKVRNGSHENVIALIVKQSDRKDCVLIWDVQENQEMESFDMDEDMKVFWDQRGYPYLTQKDQVCIAAQGVRLTCFDVEKINRYDKGSGKFGFHVGHKFDAENHSWAYLRDYISLSFSYMTFVIKKKLDDDNDYLKEDFLFDKEQYNYIISKRTAFTDTLSNVADHDKLLFILKHFQDIDPVMLEQLQYYNVVKNENDQNQTISALHSAYVQDNARSIKILFTYMGALSNTSSYPFKDILPELIEYNGFTDYLEGLTFKTVQLENKQALRVQHMENEAIVSLKGSSLSYIDNTYFYKTMGEDPYIYYGDTGPRKDPVGDQQVGDLVYPDVDPDYISYPVRVEALKVDWLLQPGENDHHNGQAFLRAVLNSQNMDLLEIPFLQIVIEYLYRRHLDIIGKKIERIYILHVVCYYAMVILHESAYTELQKIVDIDGKDTEVTTIVRKVKDKGLIIYFTMVFICLNCVSVLYVAKTRIIPLKAAIEKGFHLSHVWSVYFEWIQLILNLILSFMIAVEATSETKKFYSTRILAAFNSLLIWEKPMNYLQQHNAVSRYIVIFKQTLYHVAYFMSTVFLTLIIFALSFYLLGQNQVEFNKVSEDDAPIYATSYFGALQYMYLLSLGELGSQDGILVSGEGYENYPLRILFSFASFIMIIELLNLLVALMGEPFAENEDIEEARITKEHLRFVMEHWNQEVIQNQCQYLITAFLNEEEEEDVEQIQKLGDEIKEMKSTIKTNNSDMIFEIEKIRRQLESVIAKVEERDDQ